MQSNSSVSLPSLLTSFCFTLLPRWRSDNESPSKRAMESLADLRWVPPLALTSGSLNNSSSQAGWSSKIDPWEGDLWWLGKWPGLYEFIGGEIEFESWIGCETGFLWKGHRGGRWACLVDIFPFFFFKYSRTTYPSDWANSKNSMFEACFSAILALFSLRHVCSPTLPEDFLAMKLRCTKIEQIRNNMDVANRFLRMKLQGCNTKFSFPGLDR